MNKMLDTTLPLHAQLAPKQKDTVIKAHVCSQRRGGLFMLQYGSPDNILL